MMSVMCPQLPPTAPSDLASGFLAGQPPLGWSCPASQYFEINGTDPAAAVCHCGCGVIDPDCGYELPSCSEQAWLPQYVGLECGGVPSPADQLYCRLESASCQPLPPGLARGATTLWTCIPDVYNELSDPGTSLNDCDCNCGDFDPDCLGNYNDLYCGSYLDSEGDPRAIRWTEPVRCQLQADGMASCEELEDDGAGGSGGELDCPQLPTVSPTGLAQGYLPGQPPPGWTCDPELYYELGRLDPVLAAMLNGTDMDGPKQKLGEQFACDCECGVVDPDCGYVLPSCADQTWNPGYSTLRCAEGAVVAKDLMYCRLESASCQVLPPGLARGSVGEWTCIPDVYNELADNGTSLNDCDCSCGWDPDCANDFDDIYCEGVVDVDGIPIPMPRALAVSCALKERATYCASEAFGTECPTGTYLDSSLGLCVRLLGVLVPETNAATSVGMMTLAEAQALTVCAALAVDHVNDRVSTGVPSLSNLSTSFHLAARIVSTHNDADRGLRETLSLQEVGVAALVGLVRSDVMYTSALIAGVGSQLIITPTATDTELGSRKLYSTLVRINPRNDAIAAAVCETFVRFGWKHIGLVSSPEAEASTLTKEILNRVGADDTIVEATVVLDTSTSDILAPLKAAGVQIILAVLGSDDELAPLLARADAAGLLGAGRVWVFAGGISVNPGIDVTSHLSGSLLVHTREPTTAAWRDWFKDLWHSQQAAVWNARLPPGIEVSPSLFDQEPPPSCARAYDSIAALSLVLDQVGIDNSRSGEALYNALEGLSLQGLNGDLELSDGEHELESVRVNLFNWQADRFEAVGEYSLLGGLLTTGDVQWRGGGGTPIDGFTCPGFTVFEGARCVSRLGLLLPLSGASADRATSQRLAICAIMVSTFARSCLLVLPMRAKCIIRFCCGSCAL